MSLFWLCRKIFCSEVPLQRSLFCILLFLLLPTTPLREMLSVYIECTSHTHTQACLPPPIMLNLREDSAWHLSNTQSGGHACYCSCRRSDILRRGIYVGTHAPAHHNLLTYVVLQPLLDHPIWRLEPIQKTMHLQRQRGGSREMEGGGRDRWEGSAWLLTRRKRMEWIKWWGVFSDVVSMPQLPVWLFCQLHCMSSSVAPFSPSLPPNNEPITGLDRCCSTVPGTLGCFRPSTLGLQFW